MIAMVHIFSWGERWNHHSVPLHAELYHCAVLFNDDVTYVQWSTYFISRDPVSSNQMTRIYIGLYNTFYSIVLVTWYSMKWRSCMDIMVVLFSPAHCFICPAKTYLPTQHCPNCLLLFFGGGVAFNICGLIATVPVCNRDPNDHFSKCYHSTGMTLRRGWYKTRHTNPTGHILPMKSCYVKII